MARKKKVWNASNPLYRYIHGGKKKHRRSSGSMTKRKHYGKKRSSGKFMGLSSKGLVSLGLIGAAAGVVFGETLGSYIPIVNQQEMLVQGAVGAFIVGGPLGAVGNVIKQTIMGRGALGGSSGNAPVY